MSRIIQKNKTPLHYSRDKNKVDVNGDPSDVKWVMWFHFLTTTLPWLIICIVLLFTVPKASFIPLLWKWFTGKILTLLILFTALVDSSLLLSG